MKTLIVFAFLAILSISTNGQPNASAEELFRTADEFKSKSIPDSAVTFYERAAIEFTKNRITEHVIDPYNQIGAILNRQDKYDKAKEYLEKALAFGRSLIAPESLAIATTYITLGVTYGAENQFHQSLTYHNKA